MTSLAQLLLESFSHNSDRTALEIGAASWSYDELRSQAEQEAQKIPCGSRRVGVVAGRGEPMAYVWILACVLKGCTYVPINPEWPLERREAVAELARLHHVFGSEQFSCVSRTEECGEEERVGRPGPAYILFTSGSTGVPKGVCVAERNVLAYLSNVQEVAGVSAESRCTQSFELTFDLSVHDLFVAWQAGACLVAMEAADLLFPAAFLQRKGITHWFSVPTLGAQVQRLGQLTEGAFPLLQRVLFCGEALPQALAAAWSSAAPHAEVYNLYGPTEATIAILFHRFDLSVDYPRGIVAIGFPWGNERAWQDPLSGELILSGDQVAPWGYWNASAEQQQTFALRLPPSSLPTQEKDSKVWSYNTGDRVSFDSSFGFLFIGRSDSQVKVHGHRIEISEVEHLLRRYVVPDHEVHVILLPGKSPPTTTELVAVACADSAAAGVFEETRKMEEMARAHMPHYMVPSRFVVVPQFPTNTSGKIDRRALTKQVEQYERG